MNIEQIDKHKSELIKAAIKAKSNSYCIISHFAVGAAVLSKSGHIFTGVNVENSVLPCGWCAEVSAIASSVSNGHRDIIACAVSTNATECIAPCGQCRQVLAEFAQDDLSIFMIDGQGNVEHLMLSKLLPLQFGKQILPDLCNRI